MAGYTKEFLVAAYVHRFRILSVEQMLAQEQMANEFYDKVGKDKFRAYCSLDAEALREYKKVA